MAAKRIDIKIGGVPYTLSIEDPRVPKDRWGDCSAPTSKSKRVRVSKRATGVAFIDTLLHELIHARWWCLDEDEVSEFASEVAQLLFHLREKVIDSLEEEL